METIIAILSASFSNFIIKPPKVIFAFLQAFLHIKNACEIVVNCPADVASRSAAQRARLQKPGRRFTA
jgi:hypothetical protein